MLLIKLIISLSLGFVVFGALADSLDGQSLQKPTLDVEDKPTYPQFLIPNARLRILIDSEQGSVASPQQSRDELEIDRPLSRAISTTQKLNPTIVTLPDGTLSLALDKHHLKYHTIQHCANPEHKDYSDKDKRSTH